MSRICNKKNSVEKNTAFIDRGHFNSFFRLRKYIYKSFSIKHKCVERQIQRIEAVTWIRYENNKYTSGCPPFHLYPEMHIKFFRYVPKNFYQTSIYISIRCEYLLFYCFTRKWTRKYLLLNIIVYYLYVSLSSHFRKNRNLIILTTFLAYR